MLCGFVGQINSSTQSSQGVFTKDTKDNTLLCTSSLLCSFVVQKNRLNDCHNSTDLLYAFLNQGGFASLCFTVFKPGFGCSHTMSDIKISRLQMQPGQFKVVNLIRIFCF